VPRWGVGLLAVAVVAVGLLAWWGTRSPAGGDDANGSGVRPIARIESTDIHALLIDSTNADTVRFGSHAGIQESRDGGYTWKTGSLKNADAMSLASSPQNAATLYAAGHNVFQVSRDGGATWQAVQHNLPGTDIHAFAQDPSEPKRLYAFVVGAGLLASQDGGTRWDPVPTQPPGGSPQALASSGADLYAPTSSGLAVSRNQGATWDQLATPPGGIGSLAIPASDPLTMYAGTPAGLARSVDGGQTWTIAGPAGIPVLALAAASSDPLRVVFVAAGGDVYRSDDGGASWLAPK